MDLINPTITEGGGKNPLIIHVSLGKLEFWRLTYDFSSKRFWGTSDDFFFLRNLIDTIISMVNIEKLMYISIP